MNLIDLKVTEVLSEEPYQITENGYFIIVKAEAYGKESEYTLMFDTKKEAQEIKPGYIFQG